MAGEGMKFKIEWDRVCQELLRIYFNDAAWHRLERSVLNMRTSPEHVLWKTSGIGDSCFQAHHEYVYTNGEKTRPNKWIFSTIHPRWIEILERRKSGMQGKDGWNGLIGGSSRYGENSTRGSSKKDPCSILWHPSQKPQIIIPHITIRIVCK